MYLVCVGATDVAVAVVLLGVVVAVVDVLEPTPIQTARVSVSLRLAYRFVS
jgi:hypothetical protein